MATSASNRTRTQCRNQQTEESSKTNTVSSSHTAETTQRQPTEDLPLRPSYSPMPEGVARDIIARHSQDRALIESLYADGHGERPYFGAMGASSYERLAGAFQRGVSKGATALVERTLQEREQQNEFMREPEREEQMIREERAREEQEELARKLQRKEEMIREQQKRKEWEESMRELQKEEQMVREEQEQEKREELKRELQRKEQMIREEREREEREEFTRELQRKEQMIREARERERWEKKDREWQKAERWPSLQEGISIDPLWLCEHYQGHCRVQFPCCRQFYPCHHCHNGSSGCQNDGAKACDATQCKCSCCQFELEVKQMKISNTTAPTEQKKAEDDDESLDSLSAKDDKKKIVQSRSGTSIRSSALNGEAEDNSSYRSWERQGTRPKDRRVQPPVDPLLLPSSSLVFNNNGNNTSKQVTAKREHLMSKLKVKEELTEKKGEQRQEQEDSKWQGAELSQQEDLSTGSRQVNQMKISSATAATEQKKAEGDDNSPDVAAETSFLSKMPRNKLVDNKTEVEVQRNDPSSPSHSVKSFEELPLSEQLRRAVYDMGFNNPSKIQETALPMLLADPPNNMIVQSQPGTGKTAAFVMAMLSRVDETQEFTQGICLLPTYELALQTGQVAEKMSKFCPEIKIGYAVRGKRVLPGHKVTDHILFGTPGIMLDWILRHKAVDPRKIKMLVLDDASFMIAIQGHQDNCIRIQKKLPEDCQIVLCSETYDDELMEFADRVVLNPSVICLNLKEEIHNNVKQVYVVCRDQTEKQQALSNMYGLVPIGQCIAFCRTRESASWLTTKMTAEGHSVALLSGEITVEQRLAVLNRFRNGKEKLLITTDVCARGIDVGQVTAVVNYDMPVEPTVYLHRICRTGWLGQNCIAVNLIDSSSWSMNIMKKIEEDFGWKISLLERNDVEELEKRNEFFLLETGLFAFGFVVFLSKK
ncbi:ATP-dependent RNA helicase DBP5-like [Acropora millepora]|uniref:ATP-dependent RNA helicase DBP5-like n=1 Tax=Acropora millepora TaxID=45264 RepID=UPI001CF53EA7|nr:ATP-dependent RNA helicase DBP5-like [Acropora millepora]